VVLVGGNLWTFVDPLRNYVLTGLEAVNRVAEPLLDSAPVIG
jgi:hypothetical protein